MMISTPLCNSSTLNHNSLFVHLNAYPPHTSHVRKHASTSQTNAVGTPVLDLLFACNREGQSLHQDHNHGMALAMTMSVRRYGLIYKL